MASQLANDDTSLLERADTSPKYCPDTSPVDRADARPCGWCKAPLSDPRAAQCIFADDATLTYGWRVGERVLWSRSWRAAPAEVRVETVR